MKITIFGAGRVGSTLAMALMIEFRDLIRTIHIADINEIKLLGEIEDLKDFAYMLGIKTKIKAGTGRLIDYYIITAGIPRKSSKDRHDFARNLDIVISCISAIPDFNPKIMLITNPVNKIADFLEDKGMKVIRIGNALDSCRFSRTKQRDLNEGILDTKGFTNFGVIAEVINALR